MAAKPLPSPEVLRQLLRYEPETGKLFWRERGREFFPSDWSCTVWNKRFPGKEALTAKNNHGYPHGALLGRSITAHRIAWAIFYGEWPAEQIDHINNDRADFRIANLRQATNSQNHMNKPMSSVNSSGFKGVDWSKKDKVWRARIKVKGKQIHLGHFNNVNDAAEAYKAGAAMHHGEFARTE